MTHPTTEVPTAPGGRNQNDKPAAGWRGYLRELTPKSVIMLREGYTAKLLGADAMAGLTVAILALPLSIAIAIAAGATPGQGLVTSVIAGFLISAFGGSRYQVGGPAAAFIIVIVHIVERHGMAGMVTTTFLAGVLLMIAGMAKLGTYVKYVPGPVIQGFTTGVGLLIALRARPQTS
jgi:SulP family sulfate permease